MQNVTALRPGVDEARLVQVEVDSRGHQDFSSGQQQFQFQPDGTPLEFSVQLIGIAQDVVHLV